jgi:hypothetical protein
MPVLKSKLTEYSYSLLEIKRLIAKDLEVEDSAVSVKYVMREVNCDPMDRYPEVFIEVTVNDK